VSFPNFGSLRVAVNLVGDNAFLGVAAIGATFVILSGGIDLSVGAAVALTRILIAPLVGSGMNPFLVIVIALLIGAIFGTAMGCLIQWFELPPFLVTLAGMFLARGMGFVVHSQSLGIEHPFFLKHITEDLSIHLTERVSVPFTATCFLVILLAALLVAHDTPLAVTSTRWAGTNNPPPSCVCPLVESRSLPTRFRDFVPLSLALFARSTRSLATPPRAWALS
jgi:simple sugar transport system permease protein